MTTVNSKDTPRYRIQVVAKRTGVPATTLRAWERRYGIPRPRRSDAAYRTYSDRDIELVQQLRQLCDSGLSPADAASMLRDEQTLPIQPTPNPIVIDGISRAPEFADPSPSSSAFAPRESHQIYRDTVERIVSAVKGMNVETLEAELLSARKLGTGRKVFEHVLRRSLEAVGQLWHSGDISIGHEHVASETINATARELLRLAQPSHTNRLALLASFADELHYASLYGVGFVLAEAGCRVAILGALTPPSALGPAVRKLTPEVVGLSVTIPPSGARARELVEGYAIACGNVPWVVGGRGVAPIARLVTEFGGIVAQGNEEETRRLFQDVLSERRNSS